MSTNFLVLNPTCANQESDATYASDSTRTGGYATDQIVPSPLLNKFSYQASIFITALAQALVAKGYSPNDGSASPISALTALTTVLLNIMTAADVVSSISIGNVSGHIKFGTAFSNLTIQWGNANVTLGGTTLITFPVSLTHNPAVFLTPDAGNAFTGYYVASQSTTSFNLTASGSGIQDFFWLAIGN